MRRSLLLGLALTLLPLPAWGSGGGFVDFGELVEPANWRWFEDDDQQRPTPPAATGEPVHGVRDGDSLRLRYQVACREIRVDDGSLCWDWTIDLGHATGRWSCLPTLEEESALLTPGGAWSFGDGLGDHGDPVAELLLAASDVGGFHTEGRAEGLAVTVQSDELAEYDFALQVGGAGWQPNTRHVFIPHHYQGDPDPSWELVTCNPATLCTRAGAPLLEAGGPLGWIFAAPYSASLDVIDWDDDGRQDVLVGMVHSSPILYLNETGPLDEVPRFGAGRLLVLPLADEVRHTRAVAYDWDDDGDMDLLAGAVQGHVWLYANDGSDRFERIGTLQFPNPDGGNPPFVPVGQGDQETNTVPEVVDWNGDELPDLVLGARSGSVRLYLNPGPVGGLEMGAPQHVMVGDNLVAALGRMAIPKAVDYDEDGLFDLLLAFQGARVRVLRNAGVQGEPRFDDAETLDLGDEDWGQFVFPAITDLDFDGTRELLVGTLAGNMLVYPDTGVPGQPEFPAPVGEATAAPSDVLGANYASRVLWDEYGVPPRTPRRHDLMLSYADGRIEVLLGLGNEDQPRFGVHARVRDAVGQGAAAVWDDVDGDGVRDLVVGLADGSVIWGRGGRRPPPPRAAGAPRQPLELAGVRPRAGPGARRPGARWPGAPSRDGLEPGWPARPDRHSRRRHRLPLRWGRRRPELRRTSAGGRGCDQRAARGLERRRPARSAHHRRGRRCVAACERGRARRRPARRRPGAQRRGTAACGRRRRAAGGR